jgi:hypothetical protein
VVRGAHVGFDGLKLFAQLGIELATCFEGAAQISLRGTIAQRLGGRSRYRGSSPARPGSRP